MDIRRRRDAVSACFRDSSDAWVNGIHSTRASCSVLEIARRSSYNVEMREPDETANVDASEFRRLVVDGLLGPQQFGAALASIPRMDRDAWVDSLLCLEEIPSDGPDLPAGCVPYLPCSVDTLVRVVELAQVSSRDVFVDIGGGLGRAAAIVHLLTGAGAIGIEVQSELAREARAMASGLAADRVRTIHGDAGSLTRYMMNATIFFLYCPFSGERLRQVLSDIEDIARTRELRVCSVDLPIPSQAWLEMTASFDGVTIYRSTTLDRGKLA